MWEMIRGGTGQHIPVLHISKNQVVHIGATLGSIFKAVGRGENVVVHNVRAMGNFHHKIPDIVGKQVSADSGSLGLPVQPDSQGTIVDIIFMNLGVNGCMEFDACDLIPVKLMFHSNVINLISVNITEYAS